MRLVQSKPMRAVVRWQAIATAVMALLGGLLAGIHGAISATLGGLISIVAGLAFALVISLRGGESAAGVLGEALLAEAAKIALIVVLLWLVLATYGEVVVVGFIGTFVIAVVIFAMALFVREQ